MRIKNILKTGFCSALLAVAIGTSAQTVTVNLTEEYQEIQGFGGMNHTTWIGDLNADQREKAFGNEPGQMGLSILRIHLDPDANRFNLEVPTATYAIQKGAIVFATPWNAPTDLRDATENKVAHDKYGEYVAHLNAFDTYMTNNNAPLYAISVQNEPDYGEWTRWTSAEMVDFMSNYAQGIDNKVIAPESFQFRRTFTDPILNNTAALANLDIVGGHIYGGGLADYPLARQKGKEVWMTEHLLGSNANETNDWNLALTVGKEINDCMKANFNAYVWWYIRRYYGLMADDGNITDKGYVLAQYSKFVRKGAIRVGVNDAAASQVDVTAYKEGDNFVMVVINRNATSVNLNFDIQNGSVGQLTQFTSSETKKIANDGSFDATGGSFSATVDAKSVTTFASSAVNGGKQGNVKPIAFAGDDLTIDDAEGTGSAVITLDGSQSSDADGQITNYSWALNGKQVAWSATHELTIASGEYDLALTVTDNDGATATDIVHITLKSSKNEKIWLEAECGTVGSSWQKPSDTNASGGKYVVTTDGVESTGAASTAAADLLIYNFATTETGNYKIWGRVIAPSANDDSFWVKVDDADWVMWNGIPAGTDWHWDDVHSQNNDSPMLYNLAAGEHTLSICMREDGAQIDKILIANTGVIPTNSGESANNCSGGASGITLTEKAPAIAVYPNPSTGNVNIAWAKGFESVQVFNTVGQLVHTEMFDSKQQEASLRLNLEAGVYLVLLRGNNVSGASKLIIR